MSRSSASDQSLHQEHLRLIQTAPTRKKVSAHLSSLKDTITDIDEKMILEREAMARCVFLTLKDLLGKSKTAKFDQLKKLKPLKLNSESKLKINDIQDKIKTDKSKFGYFTALEVYLEKNLIETDDDGNVIIKKDLKSFLHEINNVNKDRKEEEQISIELATRAYYDLLKDNPGSHPHHLTDYQIAVDLGPEFMDCTDEEISKAIDKKIPIKKPIYPSEDFTFETVYKLDDIESVIATESETPVLDIETVTVKVQPKINIAHMEVKPMTIMTTEELKKTLSEEQRHNFQKGEKFFNYAVADAMKKPFGKHNKKDSYLIWIKAIAKTEFYKPEFISEHGNKNGHNLAVAVIPKVQQKIAAMSKLHFETKEGELTQQFSSLCKQHCTDKAYSEFIGSAYLDDIELRERIVKGGIFTNFQLPQKHRLRQDMEDELLDGKTSLQGKPVITSEEAEDIKKKITIKEREHNAKEQQRDIEIFFFNVVKVAGKNLHDENKM